MKKQIKSKKIKVLKFKKKLGFVTTTERSSLMKKIRSKNTKPEVAFRKKLWAEGFRYRKNVKSLPGSPDVVIRKYMLIIFIDGEFWHGYNWVKKKGTIKANRKFWIPKIERNIQRDLENTERLEAMGFLVMRFWEHEIKKDIDGCVGKIKARINIE
jgi:DNA mismatch endonuclease (patch repair protein)